MVAEFASRNNSFNPETGCNLRMDYMWYRDALGSDVSCGAYTITSLNYLQLQDKWNLGLRLQYDAIGADDETRLPAYAPPGGGLR
ncbi:MAG: hypothetical protein ACI9JM_001307 [Halioglobus sp.]